MIMKKRVIISSVCILALLLIAGGMWYTRPMTLTELFPKLDVTRTDGLSAMYSIYDTSPDGKVDSYFQAINLDSEDPATQQMLEILDSHTYHRGLISLLPRLNITTVTAIKNPNAWDVVVFGGYSLRLSVTTGQIDLRYRDDTSDISLYCTAEDQEAFVQEVYELLVANTPKE